MSPKDADGMVNSTGSDQTAPVSALLADLSVLILYRIYYAIKWGFLLSRMTTNNSIILLIFAIIRVLPFLNNPIELFASFKMDLDFLTRLWKEKTLSYN